MKKILLTVMAVLLTAGAMAQNAERTMRADGINNLSEMQTSIRTAPFTPTASLTKLSTMKKAAPGVKKAAPSGEKKVYYLDFGVYANGYTELAEYLIDKYHFESDIYVDGNKMYIPIMMLTSILDPQTWVEGTISADGTTVTIPTQQSIGSAQAGTQTVDLCLGKLNPTNGEIVDDPITLTIDKASGIMMTEDYLAVTDKEKTRYFSYCMNLAYAPESFFPAATTHTYTATNYEGEAVNTTVDIVEMSMEGSKMCYIKNLIPYYENQWLAGAYDEQGNINIPLQGISDDMFTAPLKGQQVSIGDPVILKHDAAAKAYKSETGVSLGAFILVNQSQVQFADVYSNIVISETSAGINNAVTGDEGKEVVSSELFDLSGRRVSDTQNGVLIKVTKYADGSSNATKIIK